MRIRCLPFFRPSLAAVCLLLLITTGAAWAEPVNLFKMYKLPRGLAWGLSEAEVQAIIARERATITNKDGDAAAEIWEVKGLFVSNLDSASFTFIDRKLEGIELRYGNPKWSERKAQGIFGDFQIVTEHAIGNADDHHREKGDQAGVQEITDAMEWRIGEEVVRLVFFSAIKGKEAFYLVSVHLTRKQGEEAMKAIAEAGALPADLKDPPGAGGPGQTLFLVEPDLPGDPAAEAAAIAAMNEAPLPGDLFSETNLQAGSEQEKTEVDALAIAADAAAATDVEAAATMPTGDVVQEQSGAAQAVVEALKEMSAPPPASPVPPSTSLESAPKAAEEPPQPEADAPQPAPNP